MGFSLGGASPELERSSFPVKWVERSPERWILEINRDVDEHPQSIPESNPFREISSLNFSSPFIVPQYGIATPIYSQWILFPEGYQPKVRVAVQRERASTLEVEKFDLLNSFQNSSPQEERSLIEAAHNEAPWWVRIEGPYHIGGTQWGILEITPYQWDEQERALYKATGMRIEIEWEASQNEPQRLWRESYAWQEVLRGLAFPTRDFVGRMDLLGHYVIILPHQDRALQAITPLVEWKRRMGYKVTVVTTQEVGNTAESIKGWLNRAWEEWDLPPTYVLLVGEEQGELRMPTFFDGAQPQMSWYMSDQKFVQFEGQGDNNPDMWIPEAFIGRLPVGNVQELQRMVAKIIGYERNPFLEQAWVEGAVLIAQGVRSCIHTNIAIKEILRAFGYSNERFYEAYNDYPQEVDHNIINQGVDRGIGFINFRGYNNWANYTPAQIRDRRNGWKLPIVFGMVCATNDWSNRYAPNEAIGEAWLRAWQNNEPAGAVACFGPTDLYTHTWFNNTMDG
ncbi:MAG: C25 family cysteine peptidase, partial [bacterium]